MVSLWDEGWSEMAVAVLAFPQSFLKFADLVASGCSVGAGPGRDTWRSAQSLRALASTLSLSGQLRAYRSGPPQMVQ